MTQSDSYPSIFSPHATPTTTDEALRVFDTLDSVDLSFMLGRWRGSGIHTSHPMDGLLEASNWYGKEFVDADQVHPLLFSDAQGGIFKVAPNPIAMNLMLQVPLFKYPFLSPAFAFTTSLFKTNVSQARLRMMEYRGKVSATMIYDHLPIHDAFRKVDDDTVFGAMDFKPMAQPFFFMLKRSA